MMLEKITISQVVYSVEQRNDSLTAYEFYCLANKMLKKNNYDSTEFFLKKAIVIEKHDKTNQRNLTTYLFHLASLYNSLGMPDMSLSLYDSIDEIYSAVYSQLDYSYFYLYSGKANAFMLKKDFERSLVYFEKALEISRRFNKKKEETILYQNIGSLFYFHQNYEKARFYYEKALKNFRVYDPKMLYYSYFSLAFYYRYSELKDYSKAEKYCKLAMNSVAETSQSKRLLCTYTLFLANLNFAKGDNVSAELYFNQSLLLHLKTYGLKHHNTSIFYNDFGKFMCKIGNINQSLVYFQYALISEVSFFNSLKASDNPSYHISENGHHIIEVLKNKAKCLLVLYGSRPNIKDIAVSIEYENGKNKTILLNMGKETLSLAMQLMDKTRKSYLSRESRLFLSKEQKDVYSIMLEILFELYKNTNDYLYLNQAFQVAEQSKASGLYLQILENQSLLISDLPNQLRDKYNMLSGTMYQYQKLIDEEQQILSPDVNKITQLRSMLLESELQFDKLNDSLKFFNNYQQNKVKNEIITISKLQSKLKSGETVVEYSYTDTCIFTFVITSSKLFMFKIPIDSTFKENLVYFKQLFYKQASRKVDNLNFEKYVYVSNYLYNRLILPIERFISGNHITIVADEDLNFLSFDCLLSSSKYDISGNYSSLAFLLKKYALSYAFSASIKYNSLYYENMKANGLVAFAPNYISKYTRSSNISSNYRDELVLAPLKYTKNELQGISSLFSCITFEDSMATTKNFLENASKFKIIHLAMHSIVNDTSSQFSSLVFSTTVSKRADQFLYAYEISNLNLNSEMVILSSCNTGRGSLSSGEGVISLSRAFAISGCKSIINTLWSTSDKSSAEIMIYFYQNLALGQSKDEALQNAKVKYLETSSPYQSNPFFWSQFVLVGNTTAISAHSNLTFYFALFASGVIFSLLIYLVCKFKVLPLNFSRRPDILK